MEVTAVEVEVNNNWVYYIVSMAAEALVCMLVDPEEAVEW